MYIDTSINEQRGIDMEQINRFYLNEMTKFALLTREEEKSLAEKAFAGDKQAQNRLVEANLRFVIKIAQKYKGYMDLEDLVLEGNLGLMHAAEKYNPASKAKFSTYAVWWIKEYIQKAIRETAVGIKFPAAKYKDMLLDKWNFASLDKQVKGNDGETTSLMNLISDDRNLNPEDEYIEQEAKSSLSNVIKNLKEYEQTVIVMRYGLDGEKPMSLSEVGNAIGCSKERVRQIEVKAMKTLRDRLVYNIAA